MFEHSLIDLEAKRQPKGRRWISLPVAIALHLVILGSVAFAGMWDVGSIMEPEMNTIFVSIAPPPPVIISKLGGGKEPKGPEEEKQPEKPPVDEPVKRETVQPTEEQIPDELPGKAEVQNDVLNDLPVGPGDPEGHPDGHIDGHKDGVLEGVVDGDPNVKVPSSGGGGGGVQEDVPVRLTASMTKPVAIHRVQPRYTETARRAGVQGVVIVEAVIDEQGRVTNVRVLRGLPMGLEQSAVDAVQQWRFRPAMASNGKPIKVFFSCTVDFRIQR